MKIFSVRCSYTDRKFGPGMGKAVETEASSFPGAAGKGAREFWKGLNTKQRNDVQRSGLTIQVFETDRQP